MAATKKEIVAEKFAALEVASQAVAMRELLRRK